MLCGSCFRHSGPKRRLRILCELYWTGLNTPDSYKGLLCRDCKHPLTASPTFTEESLIDAIARTARIAGGAPNASSGSDKSLVKPVKNAPKTV